MNLRNDIGHISAVRARFQRWPGFGIDNDLALLIACPSHCLKTGHFHLLKTPTFRIPAETMALA